MRICKIKKLIIFSIIGVVIMLGSFVIGGVGTDAAINPQINYQGKLTDTNNQAVADGAYDFVFKLYTAAGSGTDIWNSGNGESWTDAALWTETTIDFTEDDAVNCGGDDKIAYTTETNESSLAAGQYLWNTTDKESAVIKSVDTANNYICVYDTFSVWDDGDDATNRIYVKNGLFSVMLGTITSLSSLNFNQSLWLGVTVEPLTDSEMIPRKKLGAVPAAFEAKQLGGKTWAEPDTIGSTTPNTGAFTTLTSSGNTTLATGASTTNTFGAGASSINTIGSISTPGTLTLHGATILDNTFTVSGSHLTSLGGNLTVTGTAWTATPTISGLITATSGLTANGALTANSTFTLGDNGDLGSINTSDWDISTTGVITNASMSSTQLTDGGTISFDWIDDEVANALTISGGVIGSNSISGTLTTTGALTIGDGGDTITINSSNWDVSSAGAGSGFTALTVDNINLNGAVITSDTGAISFNDESLTTTGTADFGGTTVDSLDASTGGITNAGAISGVGNLTFSGSPIVTINDGGSMTWKDSAGSPNTLMTLADGGTTGNLNITGTLTVSGGTFDISGAATDFEIKDNTASAFTISQSTNEYFNISTTDTTTSFLIDLPVAGSSSTTANLFTSNIAKTINLGTGTAIDTINIGTDATTADVINIGSSGAGNITLTSAADIDFKSVSTSVLTVQDADRLKMRDKTLFAIGDINEGIIDDMEVVSDWTASDVTNTPVAAESTVVKVNDGAMKITTVTGAASEGDTITKTFGSNQNYSSNDRIGFWVRATETGQIFSVKIHDTGGTTSTHTMTIDAANRWQYEEWDISGITSTDRDVVDTFQFYIDEDDGGPTIYIDQLRYYDKDNRSGEMFVDGDGHLVLAGEEGIELQANIASSLPAMTIDSAIVEVNQPFAVNVAGDVGINYDLYFAGTGTSSITSAGPLTIAAGDSNHSENLTITTQSNLEGGDSGRVTSVSGAGNVELNDTDKSWTADEWIGGTVSIVSGDGASQTQLITDNTTTQITVADWDATLGDPATNSYYTLNYNRGGDVLVGIGQSHLQIGGFKILGADSGSYVFKVSADGDVEIGGTGLGGSDLLVKQNISLTGGNITIGQLDANDAGTLTTAEGAETGGACANANTYYYVIVAVNDNGTTAYDGVSAGFTPDDAADVDDKIQVTWDPVDGATGYKLYRDTEVDFADADNEWVDGKIISVLDTTYLDDCTGDTATQTPPTSNTTGGGATFASTITLVEDTPPDLILDNSTTGADADSGYITWRGNDGAADTELDMSIFLDVTSTTDYKLSIMDDGKSTEVASIDQSGNLQIDGDLTITGNDLYDSGGDTFFETSGYATNKTASGISSDGTISYANISLPSTQLTDGGTISFDWIDDEVANALTISGGTISTSDISLKGSVTPAPTVEGRIEWDTDDDRIVVGDGAGQKIFYSGADTNLTENEVEAYIFDADAETISGNWVNTANPWADNEVANNLTITGGTIDSTTTIDKDPVITLGTDLSGNVTLSNLASGTLNATIVADAVALGGDTTGNYVGTVASGSGVAATGSAGEGYTETVALSNLTADWSQAGAFDIKLANASSELKIMESVGGAFYAILDVSDLGADQTFTLTTGGTVLTSGNYSSYGDITGITNGTGISGGCTSGTCTLSATLGTAIEKGELSNSGTLSFDWVNSEIADALTITGGVIGSNSISGTLTTTAALTIGDGGDTITINSSNWDISSAGAGSGFTALTVDNINLDGNTISATNASGLYLYDDGSNGIFIQDGGNVGIGIATPGTELEVQHAGASAGGIKISSDQNADYLILGGDAPYIDSFGTDLYLNYVNGQNINAGGDTLYVEYGGNVGIGTATPEANLAVAQGTTGTGTVATNATVTLTGTSTQFLNTFKIGDTITVSGETVRTIATIPSDTSLTATVAFSTTASGLSYTLTGGTRMVVLGNGNVGIETTTPTHKLVVGSGTLSSLNANTHIVATDASDARIGAIVDNKGTVISSGDASTYGGVFAYDYAAGSALSLALNQYGGNVGIGVTDPDTTLEVYKVGTQLKLSGGAADYATFAVAADGAMTMTTVDDGVGTEADIILMPDGNVGIGNADPQRRLHITHTGTSFLPGLVLENKISDEGGTQGTGILFSVEGSSYYPKGGIAFTRTGGYGTGKLDFLVDTNADAAEVVLADSKMTILSNGNVGIGTAGPLTKLDVIGSTRVKGTATSVLTGSINPTASTAVVGVGTAFTTELVVGDRITVTGETKTVTVITDATHLTVNTAFSDNANDTSPDKLAAELIVKDSSDNIDLIVQDNGNVGIGTIAPSSELHVTGSIYATNKVLSSYFQGDGVSYGLRTYCANHTSTNALNVFGNNGVDAFVQRVTVVADGKVGIGDTTPDEELKVVGGHCVADNAGDTCTTASGAIDADGAINANNFDLAENFLTNDDTLEPGEFVTYDPENPSTHIVRADKESKIFMGVVSTEPSLVMGFAINPQDFDESKLRPVAIAGRAPVKVCLENGSIEVGDPLTSSSIPGVGAKATVAGQIIGYALEPFNNNNEKEKIIVFISLGQIGNDLDVQQSSSGQIVQIDIKSELSSLGLNVNEYGVLEVDTLKIRELCVGSVCVTEAEFQEVFGSGGVILGCMSEAAINYNAEATQDDGTCEYPPAPILGCMDSTALNYNSEATEDDGSCEYDPEPDPEPEPDPTCDTDHIDLCDTQEKCEGISLFWYNDICNLEAQVILGCTDETAVNYNAQATQDDGSCIAN